MTNINAEDASNLEMIETVATAVQYIPSFMTAKNGMMISTVMKILGTITTGKTTAETMITQMIEKIGTTDVLAVIEIAIAINHQAQEELLADFLYA